MSERSDWQSGVQALRALGAGARRLYAHQFALLHRSDVTDTWADLHVWGDEHVPYMTMLLIATVPGGEIEGTIYLLWDTESFEVTADARTWEERTDDNVYEWYSEVLRGSTTQDFEHSLMRLVDELYDHVLHAPGPHM